MSDGLWVFSFIRGTCQCVLNVSPDIPYLFFHFPDIPMAYLEYPLSDVRYPIPYGHNKVLAIRGSAYQINTQRGKSDDSKKRHVYSSYYNTIKLTYPPDMLTKSLSCLWQTIPCSNVLFCYDYYDIVEGVRHGIGFPLVFGNLAMLTTLFASYLPCLPHVASKYKTLKCQQTI